MNRTRPTSVSAAFLVIATTALQAQTPPNESIEDELLALLNTPITVASSKAEGIMTTPSTVSVLDRAAMDAYGVQTVEDALYLATGVQVWGSPSKRQTLATIRGILQDNYSSKVLVLVDGIPTFHGSIGDGYWFRVDASILERIEVLRGPASVLYGSNAYAGAINLVLRRPSAGKGQAYASIGNHSSYRAGGWAAMAEPFGLLVSGSTGRLQGAEHTFTGADGESGPYQESARLDTVTANLEHKGNRLLVNGFRNTTAYLGTDSSFASGAGLDDRYQGALVNYTFDRKLTDTWRLRFGATQDRSARRFSRARNDLERSNVDGYRTSAFARVSWDLNRDWSAEAGVDYDKRKSMEYSRYNTATGNRLSDYNMRGIENEEKSGFLQVSYASTKFGMVLGTRYTKNDLAGSNTASRATLVFPLNPDNTIKFIAGQSYRAPTLFEQFFSRYGNPAVRPEQADTYELTYLTRIGKLFMQTTLYNSTYKGKIFRSRTNPLDPADLTVKYINGGDFKATGFELEMKYRNPGWFEAFLSADVLLKTDDGDQVLLPVPTDHYNFKYVPKFTGKAGISKQMGSWFLSLQGLYMSSSKGTGPTPPSIGAQHVISLHGGYSHALGQAMAKHTLSVRNLGDETIEFGNYVNLDQPALPVIPMDSRGRMLSYTFSVKF